MKLLLGSRCSGNTTSLILESAKFNKPILTATNGRYLEESAKQLGVEIPKPILLKNLDSSYRGRKIDGFLIDNVDYVLAELLAERGVKGNIISAGMNFDNVR